MFIIESMFVVEDVANVPSGFQFMVMGVFINSRTGVRERVRGPLTGVGATNFHVGKRRYMLPAGRFVTGRIVRL